MNKKISVFFILINISLTASSLNASAVKKNFFQGAINNKYKIQMEFYFGEADEVYGSYFYENVKINIALEGTFNQKENAIILKELDPKKNQTGLFRGKFTSDGRIEGSWSAPDGSKEMPFYLEKININDYFDLTGNWTISGKSSLDFSITLSQTCTNINGYHSGMTKNASRIDAVIIEDGSGPSIKGSLKGKTVSGTFKSGYSDAAGEFMITVLNEKEISWKIIRVSEGEIFIPGEAVLKKVK